MAVQGSSPGVRPTDGAARAARVLDLLGRRSRPLSALAISERLSIPRSTTYHLLNTLKQQGFVAREPDTRLWILGSRARTIGGKAPSIAQAMNVLEAFDRSAESLTLGEVAARSGLRDEDVRATVAELVDEGLVLERDGAYSLGLRLSALAARIAPVEQFRLAAHPHLVALRDATGETANLLVREGNDAVYLEQVDSHHALRHTGWTGKRIPLDGTAAGAALRTGGHAEVVRDAVEAGVTAIACRLSFEALVGAVGITGPSVRISEARIPALRKHVERAALKIAAALPESRP